MREGVLEVERLSVEFPQPDGRRLTAVDNVSFVIHEGGLLSLVGESGSGKSTIARTVLGLEKATAGRIRFCGTELIGASAHAFRPLRPKLQMVFQDPWAALNPRLTIGELIGEPLRFVAGIDRTARTARVARLIDRVELDPALLGRRPRQLSGGQLQRVCIARAIATEPRMLVLDEPTSSLDLSVRASITALLLRLQRDSGMAMLFITHDLTTARVLGGETLVLYRGQAVEQGPTAEILYSPRHAYTKALLDADLPPTLAKEGVRSA
jgi:ABC-type glutathione transport system ATPase component